MSIVQSPLLLGAEATGYQIQRSLRFNSSDSAHLSRVPSTAGNRKTWTWSGWVKRSDISTARNMLFSAGTIPSGADLFTIEFSSNQVRIADGGATPFFTSTALYRDPSAWLHLLIAVDTPQATAANRLRVYINGSEIAGTFSYPSQNYDTQINNTSIHYIGCWSGGLYLSGYLAECHFIDGQALTPSSFAETNATTGQWVPKAYTGTYGTNGFQLKFADNSNNTAATLGKDTSGNGNNWTPNNLSVTAGAGNDSLVDTPTSYGTGNSGGDVRGNYATLNSLNLSSNAALSNGNLDATSASSGSWSTETGTIFVNSGKWYAEVGMNTVNGNAAVGVASNAVNQNTFIGGDANGWGYHSSAQKWNNTSYVSYGATFTTGDIIGVALDMDAGTVVFYKNGVSQGTAFTGLNGYLTFAVSQTSFGGTPSISANFGQRPFAYTAPSGFKALCDTNLPAPVVAKPSTAFDVKLYTGNGSTQTISGLGFSPDLVWLKARSNAFQHGLFDVVRGTGKGLVSNTTDAEGTYAAVTSFNSDGFTNGADYNTSSTTYVAWAWDAGSSTVTNTQGSITSQVRANASAGFSIVSYTGTGTTATVGHGLGVTPALIIVKDRDSTPDWVVYHQSLGTSSDFLYFNQTAAKQTVSGYWGTPSSTTFGVLGGTYAHNRNGDKTIAYCFAPVSGYSSFGSYVGNGSATDGPFVYTGFRPRWLMIKSADYSAIDTHWNMVDTARGTFNTIGPYLDANRSAAEGTYSAWDLLSNGFKLRNNGESLNRNGTTYIYCAFAESPFQYARAR